MNRFIWKEKDIQILTELYPNTRTEIIAKKIGCSLISAYNKAHTLGLKKSEEYLQSPESGRLRKGMCHPGSEKTQFRKGNKPFNKGKKQVDYMTTEQINKTKATRFKKGHTPHNHKPVGSERITKDGYIEVKTKEPNVFELKHRVVWEEHNGEISPGCNIQFKDGNRKNTAIENLYMISREEQMMDNTIHRYPSDLKRSIRLINKLTKELNGKHR